MTITDERLYMWRKKGLNKQVSSSSCAFFLIRKRKFLASVMRMLAVCSVEKEERKKADSHSLPLSDKYNLYRVHGLAYLVPIIPP